MALQADKIDTKHDKLKMGRVGSILQDKYISVIDSLQTLWYHDTIQVLCM